MNAASEIQRGAISVRHPFSRAPSFDRDVTLAYATVGTPRRDDRGSVTNAILLLHGTTGSGEQFLGDTALFAPGGVFDATRIFAVIPDALGHGWSSKPSDRLREEFPAYGYHDLVTLQEHVLTHLGIRRPVAVIGTSMGGMHAWMWACRLDATVACVAIACEPTPIRGRNLLWRRMIVEALRDGAKLRHVMPIFALMTRGVESLESTLPDRKSTDAVIEAIAREYSEDKILDVIYEFDASYDYLANVDAIVAPVLSIQFDGDEVNPRATSSTDIVARVYPGLVTCERLAANDTSDGHQTLRQSARWAPVVKRFFSNLCIEKGVLTQ